MTAGRILSSASTPIEKGITLVEASAGTGKTFAISMHVLRAIVELEIKVDQILVVTFTVAATEELRERVRSRLIGAKKGLKDGEDAHDDVLRAWNARIEDKKHAVALLDLALLDIDCLGIFTIHGFCQRMLSEQPLESGQFFDIELRADIQMVRRNVVNDFWRTTFYRLEKRFCSLITECYPDPEALFLSIAGADDPLAEVIPEKGSVDQCCRLIDLSFAEFKRWWQRHGSALLDNLDQASRGGYLNKELNSSYVNWFQEIEQQIASSGLPGPHLVRWLQDDNLLGHLNGSRLRGAEKKKAFISEWILPGESVRRYSEAVDRMILEVRLELAEQLRRTVPRRLEQQRIMTFDDLVIRLAAALSGSGGAQLRATIQQRYKMVLIDEFQDTDSAQWQIFKLLFSTPHHILYLIGDPKQAIYRFRGADIVSYFQARQKAQRTVTLHRNFRSHPGLMEAVNTLLAGTSFSGIPYSRVEPAMRPEDGRLCGDELGRNTFVYCQLDRQSDEQPGWTAGAAHEQMMRWTVGEIARLIDNKNRVMIARQESEGSVAQSQLRPADIAILVRSNSQAEAYHDALSRVSIPSVVASKTSVFQTLECRTLLLVLRAVAAPGDIGVVKGALSSEWFGLSGDYFVLLDSDETLLGQWLERCQHYHQLWQEQGFLVMITRLLASEGVYENLSILQRGERSIANIQQLCELVQDSVQEQGLSMEQTIVWLQKMAETAVGIDGMELRLESDRDAVSIVTMHGAKGLEFPVTFCPFLISGSRPVPKKRAMVRCHDRDNRLVLDLGSENLAENRERAYAEEVQEDLRLAYVAITRAQLRCYLFWAEISGRGASPGSFLSPLGKILFPDGPCEFQSQHDHLQRLGSDADCSHLLITVTEEMLLPRLQPAADAAQLQALKVDAAAFSTSRTLTSFSGLASFSAHSEDALAGAFDERTGDSRLLESSRLPGGVRFGNIVHEALETIDYADLAGGGYQEELLPRICRRHGLDVDQQGLQQLLKNCVSTNLLQNNDLQAPFSLADVSPEEQVKELEFSLFMNRTTTSVINRVLASERTCTPLLYREMEGFLNGYIDLVCCHGGSYYVIDYKTNQLGYESTDYSREALVTAMREHNYGLQYWLYTLVVHRYLGLWLPGYSYAEHFGGVMYLFVRGMIPEIDGSGVFCARPDERLLLELDLCFRKKP